MSTIITKGFKKKYFNTFEKYFSLENFVKNLADKKHNFISLHYPYFKIKQKINTVSVRWIVFIIENELIVPIILFLKKDKKYWKNLSWINNKDLILEEYKKALEDIKNWDFEIF